MGRQSDATRARLNNLGKTGNPQNPSVEDVFNDEVKDSDSKDNLLEHGFFFLDDEPESDNGSDGSDSEDEEADEDEPDKFTNEAEIEHFNAILFKAQSFEGDGGSLLLSRWYSSMCWIRLYFQNVIRW